VSGPRWITAGEAFRKLDFISSNTVRVDQLGDDSTGTVGDLSNPFLTVQAAIDAIQALDPIPDWPVIDIGDNSFSEDLTTSLQTLVIVGSNAGGNRLQSGFNENNKPFSSLTFQESTDRQCIVLKDCNGNLSNIEGNTTNNETFDGGFTVHLINTAIAVVKNSGENGKIYIFGYGGSWIDSVQSLVSGQIIEIRDVPDLEQLFGQSDTVWTLYNCPNVVDAPSVGTLNLYNSPFPSEALLINNPPTTNVIQPTFLTLTNSAGNGTILGLASKNGIPDVGFTGFEKGSICMDTANGKLYVNGGNAITPNWRLVTSS
jgi:hypothetical protein